MAAIAAYAAIAGAAIAAYGAIQQGQYQKKAAEYNAQIAERDADAARRKAQYDADVSGRKFKMLMGKQRALYSKAGVDLASGSPLLRLTFQAEEAERDREAILWGGRTQAESDESRANLFRMQGSQASTAGYISGGSTFLTSLGSLYSGSSGASSGSSYKGKIGSKAISSSY